VLLQYSIATFLLTLLVTLATGAYIGEKSKQQLIEAHLDLYPSLIGHFFEDTPRFADYIRNAPEEQIPESLRNHLEMLLDIDTVFRVKLWNRDQTVVWSDQKELIGENFPDEDVMRRLEEGELTFELTEPHAEEHRYEQSVDLFLEIYIPVMHRGKLIGVVEIYENNRQLNREIRRLTVGNRAIIGGAGVLLYLLLFSIFAAAYRRQKRVNEQMRRTEKVTIYARIMAIADVYDALRSKRYYKPAFSHEESVEIIRGERGTQFDPQVVDAFLLHREEFRRISEAMVD
jgi:acyl carrier protein phosphodiesterase